jgi:hypothetical protein
VGTIETIAAAVGSCYSDGDATMKARRQSRTPRTARKDEVSYVLTIASNGPA